MSAAAQDWQSIRTGYQIASPGVCDFRLERATNFPGYAIRCGGVTLMEFWDQGAINLIGPDNDAPAFLQNSLPSYARRINTQMGGTDRMHRMCVGCLGPLDEIPATFAVKGGDFEIDGTLDIRDVPYPFRVYHGLTDQGSGQGAEFGGPLFTTSLAVSGGLYHGLAHRVAALGSTLHPSSTILELSDGYWGWDQLRIVYLDGTEWRRPIPYATLNRHPWDGAEGYCADCVEASDPCQTGGRGAYARHVAGRWKC